jgi:hypothetical protein
MATVLFGTSLFRDFVGGAGIGLRGAARPEQFVFTRLQMTYQTIMVELQLRADMFGEVSIARPGSDSQDDIGRMTDAAEQPALFRTSACWHMASGSIVTLASSFMTAWAIGNVGESAPSHSALA